MDTALMLKKSFPVKSPKTRPIHKAAYSQAVDLQRLLIRDSNDPNVKPAERARIARAFCDLEETKRKLKMKPLPKSVDVEKYRKGKPHKPQEPSFTET